MVIYNLLLREQFCRIVTKLKKINFILNPVKIFTLLIAIVFPILLTGQSKSKINKYFIGMEIGLGHAFTSLDKEQDRWQKKYNPSGTLNVLFVNRFNQHLMADLGIGFTAYGLIYRGRVDKYVIDFASPHISTGIGYNIQNRKANEKFFKLSTGLQLGYKGTFVDEFETYKVSIQGENRFYYFLKPELGFRIYSKKKMKGSRYKTALDIGTYFRYNFNTLGSAKIEESNFELNFEPRGNILGVYIKYLFPHGKKGIKVKKQREKALTPIIYNPRYID